MKSLDLRGAQKISSDDEKTTMEHPSGHHIVIMHKNLKPEHKAALDALPMCVGGMAPPANYADGGQVTQATPKPKQAPAAQSTTDKLIELAHHEKFGRPAFDDGGQVAPGMQPAVDPVQSPEGDASAAAGQAVNPYIKAQMLGNEAGLEAGQNEANAVTKGAQVDQALGQAQAGATGASNKRLAAAQGDFQKHYNDINGEVQNLVQDAQDNQINPNQYVENMSVPSKVTTALGMLISGLGGNSGDNNVAMKYLNDQISRNIASQQANQGSRMNLIGALQQQGHSAEGAAQIATAFEHARQANEMTALAGKFGGPKAMAAAQAFNAQKAQQSQDAITRAATLKTMASQTGSGQGIPDAIDPNLDSSYYVGGQKQYASSPKEAQDLQEQAAFLDKYKQHLKDVDQFNKTQGSTLNPLSAASGQAKALNDVGGTLLTETLTKGGAGVSRMAQRFANSGPQAGSVLQDREGGKLAQNYKMIAEEEARLKKAGLKGVQPMTKLGK